MKEFEHEEILEKKIIPEIHTTYDIPMAAALMNISVSLLRKWVSPKINKFPSIKYGSKRLIRHIDIVTWQENCYCKCSSYSNNQEES